MIISKASIAVTSQNTAEQMGLQLKEKSQTLVPVTGTATSRNRVAAIGEGITSWPVRWVDRVSISHNQSVEYQSGYTGEMSSRSEVRSVHVGKTTVFEQKELVKALVGGVIDRKVVVRQLAQGENIDIDTGLASRPLPLAPRSLSSVSSPGEKIVSLQQTDIHFEAEQMTFASTGTVVTEDGRTIEFSLEMSMDRALLSKTEQESLVHTWKEAMVLTDPLVISLDGRLPTLSDTGFEFDLDNDGTLEKVSFVSAGSGFLAFDRNGDQTINNGSELFGPGTGNGFQELAVWDGDKNQWIDEQDAVFSKLSVWTRDENGEDRLVSLKEAGIGAISLANVATQFDMTGADNVLRGRLKSSGVFLFEDGKAGSIQQIDLAARPVEKENITPELTLSLPPADLSFQSRNLPVNFLVPGFSRGPSVEQPVDNPLEALMEQIKVLKEEMNRLLGSRSPSHGVDRFSQGSGEKNRLSSSHYPFYKRINPDPGILMDGRKNAMGEGFYI